MDIIDIAKEMEAMAQTGLHYSSDKFDTERYSRLRELAAELLAGSSNLSSGELMEWNREEFGYATPKVDVRGFILSDNKVLLIREDMDEGRWTLPGGWADVNETPSESVEREVEEESGYIVKARQLLAVWDREKQGHIPAYPYHIYKIFFHCEITGGSPRVTLESSESRFFDIDRLPDLSVSRVLERQLNELFAKVQGNDLRTLYD
jgi:ADP-ribose pyrophosphatase YjhB (NUDIX family)